MKKLFSLLATAIVAGIALWATANLESPRPNPAKLFPDGALLYLESSDFKGLLNDWNSSNAQRVWLKGQDYEAFSRSRLFDRLAQAQSEFSAAATIITDDSLLASVAGKQSALALYDIGNLEFVYLTRMDQAQIEAEPLWRVRDKFEQRTEGNAQFYIHKDTQSNRTAAFAARDGWLILATREDLLAGVLDRLQGARAHSLADDAWYADALHQAKSPAADLRMVVNLQKVVPSPYFRSYWVQRNLTEMKQYRSALCDLRRDRQEYREDRALLRKPGATPIASGNVLPLIALSPADAAFSSAIALSSADRVLADLRENILEPKPHQAQVVWAAPTAAGQANVGNASDFEERIDTAPVIAPQVDAYKQLRTLLEEAQPAAALDVFKTRTSSEGVFAAIESSVVIQARNVWKASDVTSAITAAIRPGLTASQLGISWSEKTSPSGAYFALDGELRIYVAARNDLLLIANSEALLQSLLKNNVAAPQTADPGVTYAAVFRHSLRQQQNFRNIAGRLDASAHGTSSAVPEPEGGNETTGRPPFFSGNIASLSRTFADVESESIQERDEGECVRQTVVYEWKHQ